MNGSAVAVLGDECLRGIARELVETVKKNVTVDRTVRENVRAHLRVLVKALPPQARLPAGQAGSGYEDGPGAGRGSLRRVGGGVAAAHYEQIVAGLSVESVRGHGARPTVGANRAE